MSDMNQHDQHHERKWERANSADCWKSLFWNIPYVTNYATLLLLNDDVLTNEAGLLMIVSFLTLADY